MKPTSTQLDIGVVLDGTYELTARIGSGGMGTVWQARHLRLPKSVAVKVMHAEIDATSEGFARFRREAEIASQLGHPHIVEALDFNTLPGGAPYLVLEFLRGESLRQRLERGPLPLAQAIPLTRQVASGLHAAHGRGIVHRDLKPENIYLCQVEGEGAVFIKILDFGISKILDRETRLTQAGAVFGTPQYMSPEQAMGRESDARSDQFALASIVFEMLAGQAAFSGSQVVQVLFQVVHQPPPPLGQLVPSLPAAVVQVVEQGMAKSPEDRFPDVMAFATALAQAAGVQVTTSPPGVVAPTQPSLATAPTQAPGGLAYEATQLPAGIADVTTRPPPPGAEPAALAATQLQVSANQALGPSQPVSPGDPALATQPGSGAPSLAVTSPKPGHSWLVWLGLGVVVLGGGAAGYWAVVHRSQEPAPNRHASPPVVADARQTALPVRPDAAVPDTQVVASTRPARPTPVTKKPRPPAKEPPLPAASMEQLRQANALLRKGDPYRAMVIGERLVRDLPAGQKWHAYALLARAQCVLQRHDAVLSHLRNVPRARWRPILAFCRKYIDIAP
jgi:tRNA A-37 threonylcarbamoyl transferase component Bud32